MVPPDTVHKLVERLSIQKGVTVDVDIVPGANHFFTDHLDPLVARVSDYLDGAIKPEPLLPSCNGTRACHDLQV